MTTRCRAARLPSAPGLSAEDYTGAQLEVPLKFQLDLCTGVGAAGSAALAAFENLEAPLDVELHSKICAPQWSWCVRSAPGRRPPSTGSSRSQSRLRIRKAFQMPNECLSKALSSGAAHGHVLHDTAPCSACPVARRCRLRSLTITSGLRLSCSTRHTVAKSRLRPTARPTRQSDLTLAAAGRTRVQRRNRRQQPSCWTSPWDSTSHGEPAERRQRPA